MTRGSTTGTMSHDVSPEKVALEPRGADTTAKDLSNYGTCGLRLAWMGKMSPEAVYFA